MLVDLTEQHGSNYDVQSRNGLYNTEYHDTNPFKKYLVKITNLRPLEAFGRWKHSDFLPNENIIIVKFRVQAINGSISHIKQWSHFDSSDVN